MAGQKRRTASTSKPKDALAVLGEWLRAQISAHKLTTYTHYPTRTVVRPDGSKVRERYGEGELRHPEGMHTVYNGVNAALRAQGLDPIKTLDALQDAGYIVVQGAGGGARVLLAEDASEGSFKVSDAPKVSTIPEGLEMVEGEELQPARAARNKVRASRVKDPADETIARMEAAAEALRESIAKARAARAQ